MLLALVAASCDASVRLGALPSEGAGGPEGGSLDASAVEDTGLRADASDGSDGAMPPADAGANDADGGASRVVTLATGMPGVEWIAVGADHVTWTATGPNDAGAHYVAAKDGTGRVQIATEPGFLRGVVVDGPTVNVLRWVPPVSLIERSSVIAHQTPQVGAVFLEGFGLAVDETNLYAAATTKVARIDKTAEAGTPTLIAAFVKAVALVSDGDTLYVADQGLKAVVRVEKATGNVPWVHVIGAAVNDVATTADEVYVVGGGRVGHVQKTGGGLTIFELPGVNAVAIDASGVYYATTNAILRADPASPSAVETLASGFVALGRIALDDGFVYFTDPGAGAVYRLAK